MAELEPVPSGVYRNFAGGHYVVFSVGVHSETGEKFVLYVSMQNGKIYASPKNTFFEDVTVDGVTSPRFEYIGDHYET